MKTLLSLRKEIEKSLTEASIEEAALDARLLISHALGLNSIDYATQGERPISDEDYEKIITLRDQRLLRIPMSQIFGEKEFWSINFKVTKDTLTPRPDSETLIEAVLREIPDKNAALNIVDMGTGSGCLLLSLLCELPNATGLGIDISEKALKIAKENSENLNLSSRADFIISNWTENLPGDAKFDIIISNPPYIGLNEKNDLSPEVKDHEPAIALFSGPEGLDDYGKIAQLIGPHLSPDGLLALEIGHTQAANVKEIFTSAGFNNISLHKDLAGRDRGLLIK